jgi:uncharacterized protein (DUF58 family)
MLLKNWAYALVLVFIIGILSQAPWPVAFAIAAGLVLFVTVVWKRHALDQVYYWRRWTYRRGFPGEQLPVRIEVENRKLLPISWLSSVDMWPWNVGPSDEKILGPSHLENSGELVNLYSLRWYQRIERQYQLMLRKRGVYLLGPVELRSGDLFGMYENTRELESTDRLVVFPELLPLTSLLPPTHDPFGDRRSVRTLFDDPNQPMAIRPYQPEDSFRRIHWPATARTGSLQVKTYQPVSARAMVVCLNAATQAQYWMGMNSRRLEYLIKVAATLTYQATLDGYSVGLLSNGCLAHSDQPFHIPPSRSSDHLATLLTALASVTPFTTAPFERYLVQSIPHMPYGASVLIITAVLTPDLQASLLHLKRYRQHITLITLSAEEPESLPGIRMVWLKDQAS